MDLRETVASMRAASFASVPEVVKNTLASGMPDSPAMSSASSIMDSDRYRVEVWNVLDAWVRTASVISGMS